MATDDSYMKNKLKEILKQTEEAQIKSEIINSNNNNNNNSNDNNNTNSNSPVNNHNNTVTNGDGENENGAANLEVKSETFENETKNVKNELLNNDAANINQTSDITNGVNVPSTTTVTTTTTTTTPTAPAPSLSSSSITLPTSSSVYHKSYNHFQKPINSYAYRHASAAAAMAPYILAQSPSPYGAIRIPYLSQTPSPAANQQYFTGAQYANIGAPALQQQFYLCRGPNGLTYVAAPQAHMLGTQAAQAAYLQQAAGATATYAGAPAAYKLPVAALQQYATTGPQPPQPQQQIIYQAAPQPAQSAAVAAANKSNLLSTTNNIVVAGANVQQQSALQAAANQQQAQQQALQVAASQQQAVQQTQVSVHAPPTQSPKQNVTATNGQPSGNSQYNAAQYSPQNTAQVFATQNQINQINQINQMQQLSAAYQGQPTYLAYTPSGNNITTTMGGQTYYTNPSSYVLTQAGNGQQYASPTQAGIYGYTTQIPGSISNGYTAQQQPGQISMTLPAGSQAPAGYQILDYRQVQSIAGSAATVQIDQFGQPTGIPRPRLLGFRHHPYQKNS